MPKPKKVRIEIPTDIAAKIMFLSDRTCCVCRTGRKPVQIHHINENPGDNNPDNLATLCFDCHNDTMINGGFGRKLNGDQVTLYRDDWLKIIRIRRNNTTLEVVQNQAMNSDTNFIEYVTSEIEIYREREEYELLAGLYDSIGNYELRDKYIEIALLKDPSDEIICYLRGMQERADLIPFEVIEREKARYTKNKDYTQRARLYLKLGMDIASAQDYIRGILRSLEENRIFTAAFYLKELVGEHLIDKLFEEALRSATNDNDLWWQVRSLQELGWESELDNLLITNTEYIEETEDIMLQMLLAQARGDKEKHLALSKEFARGMGSE
ncbi:HNH endonuclease signature motif containing protein [Paenibacillus sp. FSL E2-0274]|uniref:HNH endonuclease signature motif containing protein n=1 Tax=Paenibacillus TaxID=44249 RepID=UPI00096FC79F|nr:HNH endonuclease signature motif containing protein [Paenibacillus odorifer]OMD12602.1 hypothetical protein BJP47_05120 [Paenibacillus odorifer]OME36251.1 hypothetical protein BSK63_03880 [Paenibacillus odorifer]